MRKFVHDNDAMDYINGIRVDWDDESSVEDYVEELEGTINTLEILLGDDECQIDPRYIEADIEDISRMLDEARERLDQFYREDEAYMEREYWSMVF